MTAHYIVNVICLFVTKDLIICLIGGFWMGKRLQVLGFLRRVPSKLRVFSDGRWLICFAGADVIPTIKRSPTFEINTDLPPYASNRHLRYVDWRI